MLVRAYTYKTHYCVPTWLWAIIYIIMKLENKLWVQKINNLGNLPFACTLSITLQLLQLFSSESQVPDCSLSRYCVKKM